MEKLFNYQVVIIFKNKIHSSVKIRGEHNRIYSYLREILKPYLSGDGHNNRIYSAMYDFDAQQEQKIKFIKIPGGMVNIVDLSE